MQAPHLPITNVATLVYGCFFLTPLTAVKFNKKNKKRYSRPGISCMCLVNSDIYIADQHEHKEFILLNVAIFI